MEHTFYIFLQSINHFIRFIIRYDKNKVARKVQHRESHIAFVCFLLVHLVNDALCNVSKTVTRIRASLVEFVS